MTINIFNINFQSLNDDRKRCFPIIYTTRINIITARYKINSEELFLGIRKLWSFLREKN